MIQIDDAGWGSLVGGVIIGACRAESPQTQHAFREVPVSYFQGEVFKVKTYLDIAAEAALALMQELQVDEDEPVKVCTGYVLQNVRLRLAAEGYQVAPAKIGEPLQTLIETELLNRVLALGVETDLETLTTKQGLYFWQCVNWLKGGDVNAQALPDRAQHCKTGWDTYFIWAQYPWKEAKSLAQALKARKRSQRRYKPW
jgi:hypothetical protein